MARLKLKEYTYMDTGYATANPAKEIVDEVKKRTLVSMYYVYVMILLS